MKSLKEDLVLYLVTDRTWLHDLPLSHVVEATLKGGVTFVQLREKNLSNEEFLQLALDLKKVTDKYNIPFVINDNVNVAIECGADGIHVGQSDMAGNKVRQLIGKDKILGVSVQTVAQAIQAEKDGADYLGVGAVFPTSSKDDACEVDLPTLRAICDSVSIPVVAIGGINKDNLMKLKGSGIDGIAVISAILAEKDIQKASLNLKTLTQEMIK